MAINAYNIKKWYLMLTGQSVLHVNQDLGRCFSKDELCGYYNNLTEKVTMQPELLESDKLPVFETKDNEAVLFPVAIFQYGLGAYDLYLETNDKRYYTKFIQCAEWAAAHIQPDGAWNYFFFLYTQHPYGAMAQGEGASLLLRAYSETKEQVYLENAKKAIDFMLTPIEKGGTTAYDSNDVILLEYTHLPAVMNGWVFAWWGLYDYVLVTHDNGHYKELMERSCRSLIKYLPAFTKSYWSMYSLSGQFASPFYHHLHIAQMQAMYQLTGYDIFNKYVVRWQKNEQNPLHRLHAFCIKAWQKVRE